jgi:hypothetical protein
LWSSSDATAASPATPVVFQFVPVFLLFLDALRQIMRQYPLSFEYTEVWVGAEQVVC